MDRGVHLNTRSEGIGRSVSLRVTAHSTVTSKSTATSTSPSLIVEVEVLTSLPLTGGWCMSVTVRTPAPASVVASVPARPTGRSSPELSA